MINCEQKRAAKGGEIGANGEFYAGGKFINTTPENAKASPKASRPRKVQIQPYTWVVDDRTPIFSLVGGAATYVDRNDRNRFDIKPFAQAFNPDGSPKVGTGNLTLSEVSALCERFNAGERWM